MTPSRHRMTPLRRRMIDDMTLRNLAPKTIESYVQRISGFAQYFKASPEHLGPDHVRAYLLHLVHERHLSWSHFNQVRSALRFLYRVTLKQDWVMQDIVCAKKPRTLPVVLSLDELTRFFAAITNLKHRSILMTAYAAGLRLSEVTHLRVADIDSQRMVIRVRQGKGQKDRYVMLSENLLVVLRQYWRVARPQDYLFPGVHPDRPISRRTVMNTCRDACEIAGLGKSVTVHTLRHYADSRIMPTETLMTWFLGLFPGPLDSPVAKMTRHNPSILSFVGIPSARNEMTSAQAIPSKCISIPTCG